MVLRPTPEEDISDSIESRLRGRISKLTNFVSSSFNKLFLDTFAEQLYEYEVRLLAAQLSGWVDYAGGPIDGDDLERLGIGNFSDLDTLNDYMLDSHLDNLGSIVGVDRDNGKKATGSVRVDTFDSSTRVPDGMKVATPPDIDGNQLLYEVDISSSYVTPSDQNNQNHVDVDVVAAETGTKYNVGSGRVTRLRSPPVGVEGVNNPQAIDGGEDEETNDELRSRIKNAIFETSGGGTTDGIKGYIIGNVDGVNDVFVDEFLKATPVYVDVIVDGGTTSNVKDAIETSRPAGIEHNLVRPTTYKLAVEVELKGTDIDTVDVKDQIESYIFGLDLGGDFIEDRMTQQILNIDPDIENILATNVRLTEVTNYRVQYNTGTDIYGLADKPLGKIDNEKHYYSSGKNVYNLGVEPVEDGSATLTAVVNGSSTTLTDGTDYDLVDDDNDGMIDSVDFSIGGSSPDDGTVFTISYDTLTSTSETLTYKNGTDKYGLTYIPALQDDSSITDNSGDTYSPGTDYKIIDDDNDGLGDTIDWSVGGSTPSDNEDFTITYEINVGSIYEVTGTLNNSSGHEFTEGVDFDETDDDNDGYSDSIDWSVGGDSPDDKTDFSVDATIQTDVVEDYSVTNREKINPVVSEVEVITYD